MAGEIVLVAGETAAIHSPMSTFRPVHQCTMNSRSPSKHQPSPESHTSPAVNLPCYACHAALAAAVVLIVTSQRSCTGPCACTSAQAGLAQLKLCQWLPGGISLCLCPACSLWPCQASLFCEGCAGISCAGISCACTSCAHTPVPPEFPCSHVPATQPRAYWPEV